MGARIANSVYSDVCPDDPVCSQFGFDSQGQPTKMMAESLLYKLHEQGSENGVKANADMFQESYTSKYGLVRIFKVMNVSESSKAWGLNPDNRQCDAPGSWYCPGRYPPV